MAVGVECAIWQPEVSALCSVGHERPMMKAQVNLRVCLVESKSW